ncbi:MAG: hypothetical protein U0325_25885 [Polyangiales bacterium]
MSAPAQGQDPNARNPWKSIVLGCLGVVLLTCIVGIAAAGLVGHKVKRFLGGSVVAVTNAAPNAPFALNASPSGEGALSLWIEIDVRQPNAPLTGTLSVRVGDAPTVTHTLEFVGRGAGCFNPLVGGRTSKCLNFAEVGPHLRGRIFLTDVTRPSGAAVAISGVLNAPPGTVLDRAQIQLRR